MATSSSTQNRSRIVGDFIRKRREALGISQRTLGLRFEPAVTTQFISNVERGVTPLPPAHVPTLARILEVPEAELTFVMEKEYASRLNHRVGGGLNAPGASAKDQDSENRVPIWVAPSDFRLMETLCRVLAPLDQARKEAFRTLCATFFGSAFEPIAAAEPRRAKGRAPNDPQ